MRSFVAQIFQSRLFVAGLILLLEASTLVLAYRFDFLGLFGADAPSSFCLAILASKPLCNTLAGVPPTILLLVVLLAFCSRLKVFLNFKATIAPINDLPSQSPGWLAMNIAGCLLILAPYPLVSGSGIPPVLLKLGPILWLIGSVAFIAGLVLWTVRPSDLRALISWKVITVLTSLLTLPQLSVLVGDKLWLDTLLKEATVELTLLLLRLFGETAIWTDPDILGIGGFSVQIGFPCAGLAGIAFSSGAMTAYFVLMRSQLVASRAILLIPLAALLSWCLNALRIAILLLIGKYISPELAVDGFHSYAGWISFTVLTGTLAIGADRIEWFQQHGGLTQGPSKVSVIKDPISAQILPFVVFIFSSLIVGAFFETPALGYPYRVMVTIIALMLFWQCLPKMLSFQIDRLAFAVGVIIAAFWLLGQNGEVQTLAETVPGLSGFALLLWVVIRLFGTAVIVPVVEELLFRGYLLKRLNVGGRFGSLVAILISSTLFSLLHGNFLLAFIAGLMLGGLVMRTGRVFNAIIAHALANGIIGAWALVLNDWSVI